MPRLLLVLSMIMAAAPCALARQVSTSFTGSIQDSLGAAIPGARLTLTSLDSGRSLVLSSDEKGEFAFSSVAPGRYRLRVESAGFAPILREFDVPVAGVSRFVVRLESGPMELPRPAPPPVPPVPKAEVPPPAAGGAPRILPPSEGAAKTPDFKTVDVFYATDRKPSGSLKPSLYFTGLRNPEEKLSYGVCVVSIPRKHVSGELEGTSVWRLDFHPDQKKHVLLVDIKDLSERQFFDGLKTSIRRKNREALVFVHGFNTSFEDAARRTGQIATDLKFAGVPILYSWPSESRIKSYTVDEENANLTTDRLRTFLEAVAGHSGAERVYLIAHSMGNRPMARALRLMAETGQIDVRNRFREFVLAAPDIDADEFRKLAGQFNSVTYRTTLYASSRDAALKASQKVHRYPRAGQSGKQIVITKSVDTIDVSSVDTSLLGHSYYGDNTSVIWDLFRLIRLGAAPGNRCGLLAREADNGTYWTFDKQTAKSCPRPD